MISMHCLLATHFWETDTETHARYWLDTLCVPCAPDASHLREKAISTMRTIYGSANMTLVLDQELLALSYSKTTVREQQMRIWACDWSRRLWTLQEAIISSNLYFRFEDTAISARELYKAGNDFDTKLHDPLDPRVQRDLDQLYVGKVMSERLGDDVEVV